MRTRASLSGQIVMTALLAATGYAAPAAAQSDSKSEPCGSLANAFGPLDYRTDRDNNLQLVESAHFTPAVEALVRGNRGYLGSDIDYTLRAYPNHHRALVSAMRYGEKLKTPQPPYMTYSIECYFVRALRFRPDDAVARMLYAQFLDSKGRAAEAITHLEHVSSRAAENGLTQHNVALLHLEANRYELALRHAHRAQALGHLGLELRARLVAVGQWRDPVPTASPTASSVIGGR